MGEQQQEMCRKKASVNALWRCRTEGFKDSLQLTFNVEMALDDDDFVCLMLFLIEDILKPNLKCTVFESI